MAELDDMEVTYSRDPRLMAESTSRSVVPLATQPSQRRLQVLVASSSPVENAFVRNLIAKIDADSKLDVQVIVDDMGLFHHLLTSIRGTVHRSWQMKTGPRCNDIERKATDLADWADLLVLAPVDYDTFARMLNGLGGNLLLDCLRSWDVGKKILLVPGMTISMWENPMTKKQLSKIRRKWTWIRLLPPILWDYDRQSEKMITCDWDGGPDLLEIINNQAELMTIGHDVDIAAAREVVSQTGKGTSRVRMPAEIWSEVFTLVGDWEVATSLGVFVRLPTPKEWDEEQREKPKDALQQYMRELEWAILAESPKAVKAKLANAPEGLKHLSSLCVKLIIKFDLTDILSYLESNMRAVFWETFGGALLPTKASAVYGRTGILEWWRTSASFLKKDYTAEAIDGASKSGFVHVLDWWRKSGLPPKYTEAALEQASSKGHILVLEWWKDAGSHQDSYTLDNTDLKHSGGRRSATPESLHASSHYGPQSPHNYNTTAHYPSHTALPPLKLKVGKAILCAAQHGQARVVQWWDESGIPYSHSDSVAKIASAHGHVHVLDVWRALKGEKFGMCYDSQVLVGPTKNGFVRVLEWWRRQTVVPPGGFKGEEQRARVLKVEYKTCDIEEALEDSVRSAGGEGEDEVRRWWARNGLNLGVGTSEWMELKTL